MDNVVAQFMKESHLYRKAILETLRAGGHNPTLCLEAARAFRQGMHHDEAMAAAWNGALAEAKSAAMTKKLEKRKNRHAPTG